MMSIPALLQIWAQNKDSVDILKDLEFVVRSYFLVLINSFSQIV